MGRAASNLEGQQFGKLIAISATDKRSHNKTVIWLCKCTACGKEVELPSTKLKNSEVLSCGCQEYIKPARTLHGESGFNALYSEYQYGAKIRNLGFEISREDFKAIVTSTCVYCGQEPNRVKYGSSGAKKNTGNLLVTELIG